MKLLRVAVARRTSGACSSARIARIWKGGCIIRAQFLGRIKEAYDRDAELAEPALDAEFAREMSRAAGRAGGARSRRRSQHGLPMPTMIGVARRTTTRIRRERLPANLTQAQRDFFGAHTYQRIDREGTFHTQWT